MSQDRISFSPTNIFAPFGNYSHGVLNRKTGLLVTSGQLGIDINGNIPNSFIEQTKICFANVIAIIKEADFDLGDIIRVNAFLTKREYFKEYMKIRDEVFENVEVKPASTLLVVSGFTKPEFHIEIEVTAQK